MKCVVLFAPGLIIPSPVFPQAAQPPAEPVRVGGPIPPPRKIKAVKPVYPPDAQAARVTGVVVIELTIAEDGTVRNAVVLRSVPMLDQAALDSVRQWQFTPTVVSGKTVPVLMTVTVNFSMQGVPPVPPTPPTGPVRLLDAGPLVWEISLERAASLPHWNLEAADPALPLAQANQKARTWLAARNPQLEFEIQSAVMTRIRRGPEVDFWYYQLGF